MRHDNALQQTRPGQHGASQLNALFDGHSDIDGRMKTRTALFWGTTALLVPMLIAQTTHPGITSPVADARIEIWKARRELRLYSGDNLLRTYPIGLGYMPTGRKERQGDGATPEGKYFVCVENPKSQFHLSLGLKYPNTEDAKRAKAAVRITDAQHRAIVGAEREGRCPPWNTELGGEFFIHGSGAGSDWTWGCPALNKRDMEELFSAASIGTPVEIRP